MSVLRQRLKESTPELSDALERSWKIALEEWLPAISPSKSSFNSYPHLRNIEACLDDLTATFEIVRATDHASCLSPLEVYVLLASVLFHDIGRTRREARDEPHGLFSKEIILRDFAALGIPNRELARVIGGVALLHDPPKSSSDPARLGVDALPDIAINPFGRLRQRPLAALLILADHMDDAYSRALPVYVEPAETQEIKGAFRREVLAVQAEKSPQLIRTVLSDDFPKPQAKQTWVETRYTRVSKNTVPNSEELSLSTLVNRVFGELFARKLNATKLALAGFDKQSRTLSKNNWRVILGQAEIHRREGMVGAWPPGGLLAVVLGDLRQNSRALHSIRHHLTPLGILISSWVVEYREHLYDEHGRETIEPIFRPSYLRNVAESMWRLTTGVLGQKLFTYEELAAEVGECDVERLKLAVRRTGILSRGLSKGGAFPSTAPAILASERGWQWNIVRSRSSKPTFRKQEEVQRLLSDLEC